MDLLGSESTWKRHFLEAFSMASGKFEIPATECSVGEWEDEEKASATEKSDREVPIYQTSSWKWSLEEERWTEEMGDDGTSEQKNIAI